VSLGPITGCDRVRTKFLVCLENFIGFLVEKIFLPYFTYGIVFVPHIALQILFFEVVELKYS
jgi:hypothetical protein